MDLLEEDCRSRSLEGRIVVQSTLSFFWAFSISTTHAYSMASSGWGKFGVDGLVQVGLRFREATGIEGIFRNSRARGLKGV